VLTGGALPYGRVAPAASLPAGTGSFALVDVDGDGRAELLGAVDSGPLRLFRSTPQGWAAMPQGENPFAGIAPGAAAARLALGDFDADGRLDLVAAVFGNIQAYRNTGPGFSLLSPGQNPFAALPSMTPQLLAFGDIDGDGRDDLIRGGASLSVAAEKVGAMTPRMNRDILGICAMLAGLFLLVMSLGRRSNRSATRFWIASRSLLESRMFSLRSFRNVALA
jgi:hypothetical protein